MRRCGHSHWLSTLGSDQAACLVASDRLQVLMRQLPNADTVHPSLVTVIAEGSRSKVLRTIFNASHRQWFSDARANGSIHLNLDSTTTFADRPILVADGGFPNTRDSTTAWKNWRCHETTRTPFPLEENSTVTPLTVIDRVYTRILFPFTDCFLVFADEVGGLQQLANRLACWVKQGVTLGDPMAPLPAIIVVTNSGQRSLATMRKDFFDVLERVYSVNVDTCFRTFQIVDLAHKNLSETRSLYLIRDIILRQCDYVRLERQDTGHSFSATHLSALFDLRIRVLAHNEKNFSFIKASRLDYPPVSPRELALHLSNLIKEIRTMENLIEFFVPIVASSLLLDSCPPHAHAFSPGIYFNTVYREACSHVSETRVLAFRESSDIILRSGLTKLIQQHYTELYEMWVLGSIPSPATWHKETLVRYQKQWRQIQSEDTCLACLRRPPRYLLSDCKHIVCETCVMLFATPDPHDHTLFRITHCFLCQQSQTKDCVVKVHNDTSGAGMLCLDGGGVRGVLSLGFLKRVEENLQRKLGTHLPVQSLFKLAYGVSSGGMIVSALFHNGWTVDHTLARFPVLAVAAFNKRVPCQIPVLRKILDIFIPLVTDSIYTEKTLETILKDTFGRSILSCSYASRLGTKFGLLVATIGRRPICRMFTNYARNTINSEHDSTNSRTVRNRLSAPLWQIVRAASAAPWFFKSARILGDGPFQDAGPLENDPIGSAMAEFSSLYPESESPDFILSLGTGESMDSAQDRCYGWRSRAICRLGWLFWEKMRDKNARQVIQQSKRYHRLNLTFNSTEPRLDDTSALAELEKMVMADSKHEVCISRFTDAALASLFYFEFDGLPEFVDGSYEGTGGIKCSLSSNATQLRALTEWMCNNQATFYMNGRAVYDVAEGGHYIDVFGKFGARVEFVIQAEFSITLTFGTSEHFHISASPFKRVDLAKRQGLSAWFGRADHKRRCSSGHSTREAKRRRVGRYTC